MRNCFKYILACGVVISALMSSVFMVNAETPDSERVYCEGVLNVGDIAVFSCSWQEVRGSNTNCNDYYSSFVVTEENKYVCIFLRHDLGAFPNGKLWYLSGGQYSKVNVDNLLSSNQTWTSYNVATPDKINTSVYGWNEVAPPPYSNTSLSNGVGSLYTNIPIFDNEESAKSYASGNVDVLKDALNYKKVAENGTWVSPFEDIVINDDNMSSPELSNVSHTGFTVVNCPDDRYMVDVYLESGIQKPEVMGQGSTDVNGAFNVNNFGLISDIEGAYNGTIDLLKDFGVDNVTALNQSCRDFYTRFPSISAYNDLLPLSPIKNNTYTYSIWGQPFGKAFIFFGTGTTATSQEIASISANNCPLAYTSYKVRYYYYDDLTGMHYGPWTHFIYFSDGRVLQGQVFQGNDGNVVETPLQNGVQDNMGNVSINTGNLIDMQNPNELFSYLRSVINNVNATGNNFMTLFASVFSFIPSDMQIALWLGIGLMIIIGVVKALRG